MNLFGRTPAAPLLSIVVPVYQVQQYLAECLESLLRQELVEVEVVVVDDGSTDRSARIAAKYARRDSRVRVVRRPNGGLSAARNTGIDAAKAPYLTFVDSDDTVGRAGFARAVSSLERSGADYALLPYRQVSEKAGESAVPPWVDAFYGAAEQTVVAHDHPETLAQATAWSKVYRRSFWDAAALSFREGVLYEDQEVTARAFVAADRIDLVPEPTYAWRVRAGSITREATQRSIGAFFDAVDQALGALAAVPGARAARASQLLSNDIPRYLRTLSKVPDTTYRERLLTGVEVLLGEPDLDLSQAPAEARVVYALLRAGRAADVEAFVAAGGFELASLRSDDVSGQPALVFPFAGDPDVPDAARILSLRQTPLDARVTRARRVDDRVDLSVLAYLRHVDGAPTSARAWWVAGGERVGDLTVEAAPEFVGHRIRTTRAGNERATWQVSGPWVSDAMLALEVTHHGRTARTQIDVPTPLDGPTGAAPRASAIDGRRLFVQGQWRELPDSVGEHVVATGVDLPLGHALPLDLDDGWLGLDDHGALVWHRLPDVPRDHLTVWWQRDHGPPQP